MWVNYRFIASCYYVRVTYCHNNQYTRNKDVSFSGRSLQQAAIFLFSNRPDLTTCSLVVWGFPDPCQHITHQEEIPYWIHSRIYANNKEGWKQTCLCCRPGSMLVCLEKKRGILWTCDTCLFLRKNHLVCSDVGTAQCHEYFVLNSAVRLSREHHWRPRAPRHTRCLSKSAVWWVLAHCARKQYNVYLSRALLIGLSACRCTQTKHK